MSFIKFISIVGTLYIFYYAVIFLLELIKQKTKKAGLESSTPKSKIAYEEIAPVRITEETQFYQLQSPTPSSLTANTVGEQEQEKTKETEKMPSNNGVVADLALETISSGGIDVTEDNLIELLENS